MCSIIMTYLSLIVLFFTSVVCAAVIVIVEGGRSAKSYDVSMIDRTGYRLYVSNVLQGVSSKEQNHADIRIGGVKLI